MNGSLPRCVVPGCALEATGWVSTAEQPRLPADRDGRVWLCPGDWKRLVLGQVDDGVQLELGGAA